MKLICGLFIILLIDSANSAPVAVHAFDIYPSEYLEVFNIIYDQELSKQFLQLYHRFGAIPNRFYADARYEFPELEKRVRGIIVDVQQRAKHLSPAARTFLEHMSSHIEIVLVGSESKIKEHLTKLVSEWSKLSSTDKESWREQFPDSGIILDSDRYQQLIEKSTN